MLKAFKRETRPLAAHITATRARALHISTHYNVWIRAFRQENDSNNR